MRLSIHPKRRTLMLAGLMAALGTTAQAADPYPAKPVTIVTAFAPGSGPDAVLRLVADKLGKAWNQRVLVENKPGGGGFIAIEAVRRAPADGYTLLQLDSEHLAALPYLYKSRGFETLKAFEPVASLFRTPFLVAVAADSKLKTMGDLIAAAKAGPVSYGSWGVGSPGHLGGEQMEMASGAEMQHVPFREVSQLFMSVGSGDVSWSFGSIPSSQGSYKAGKLRYIAVAAPKRIPQMPEVPNVAEAGGPASLAINSFVVLVAPRGVPTAVRDKVDADVRRALAEADVKARFDTFAFENVGWGPDQIMSEAAAKSRTYAELVKRKSISLE